MKELDIRYDVPIEVTKKQYRRIVTRFGQLVAHRVDRKGRYFIKLWTMDYKEELKKELNNSDNEN